ncbi:annexin XIV [Cryptococcus neoformans Bt85]|nr:annexin XIV [Cryptococcus neoformans var. grubii Bt85]
MYGQQNNYGAPPPQQWGQAPPQGYQPGYQNGPPAVNYGAHPSQQQQWGAPPGPPQHQPYGAPPVNQYGAPPQHQQGYGGHSPQPPFGAPSPAPAGYGAPPTVPQGQYGAPSPYSQQPPQQGFGGPQQGYGSQPQGQSPMMYLGVPIPAPPPAVPVSTLAGYDARFDAERIRKATKGFGTDERTIIDTLSPLDAFQMDVLSRTYEQTVGRSLKHTLEKELSSWLEYTLVLLSLGPLGGDAYLLHRACNGMGTHEDLLNEILLGRTNQEIFLLKEAYRRTYNKDLVQIVQGELSMKTERMFNMALSGQRDESPYLNHQLVQQDVETLYRAGPGKIGTDEIAICGILISRSKEHLKAIAQAFPARHRVSLSQMIHSEFSGHMRDALFFIARGVEADGDGVVRDCELLHAAMAGMGTKDERMIYRLVRNHWNRPRFNAIKNQYQVLYRNSLRRAVEGETTGKYEKALVGIIEQN